MPDPGGQTVGVQAPPPPQVASGQAPPPTDYGALIASLMQMGSLEDEQGQLGEKLKYAQSLREPGPSRYGPWGSLTQGLADAIRSYAGTKRMNDVYSRQDAIRNEMTDARTALAQAQFGGGNQNAAIPASSPLPSQAPDPKSLAAMQNAGVNVPFGY